MLPNGTNKQTPRGIALPACLLLAGIMALLGIAALSAAATESRLVAATMERHRALLLADHGLRVALEDARKHPDQLPVANELTTLATPNERLQITVEQTGTDSFCPEYPTGTRTHYEITAMATTESGATRTHVQGFSVCTESCSVADCIGVEAPLQTSYWTFHHAS